MTTQRPLIRPFTALRPRTEQAAAVAAPPYDVLSSDEARVRAAGKPLEAGKTYKVAGWAPVSEEAAKAGGEAVWDLVARYLKAQKVVRPRALNLPTLKGMAGNPGMA